MTPEEALKRAHDAAALMDNQTLKEAMSLIEGDVVEAWLLCPVRDVQGREDLWRLAVTARKFRDILKGTAESGKFAAQQIAERKSFADRAKEGLRSVGNWSR